MMCVCVCFFSYMYQYAKSLAQTPDAPFLQQLGIKCLGRYVKSPMLADLELLPSIPSSKFLETALSSGR